MRKQQPNIIFICADQLRWDALGHVNGVIKTPNLDKLAAQGLRLDQTYAPTPVCLPCRASMVTGQYPSSHGAPHNLSALREDHPVMISDAMRRRGFFTHFVGKSHLAPCHFDPVGKECAPFTRNFDYYRKWNGPWYQFERADLAIGHTVENHACNMHYGAWLEDQGVDIDKYFGGRDYVSFGAWDLPEEYHNTTWTIDRTIAGLEESMERGQPYFGWVNLQDPHNPCWVPEPWASMYDPNEIPQHGFKEGEPANFADKPDFYNELIKQPGAYAAKSQLDNLEGIGNVSHLDWDQDTINQNAACYYGMVSMIDHHVGRLLEHLDAIGERENTLIVFTADHGELLGDHGLWFKSMVTYDESIRVPMIVHQPGVVEGGRVSPAMTNLIDLFPTFCEVANIPVPWQVEGVSQWPVWTGEVDKVREYTVVEERPSDTSFNQRILIEDEYRLAFYATHDFGELYNHREDPNLIHNLWNDPTHAERKQQMIARLLEHEMNKGGVCPPLTDLYAAGDQQW